MQPHNCIIGTGHAVPERILTNAELETMGLLNVAVSINVILLNRAVLWQI